MQTWLLLSLVLICHWHTWDIIPLPGIPLRRMWTFISPNHNLSQAMTAGKLAAVGGRQRWKYFMWTSSAVATYSSKTIRSIFTGKVVATWAIRFAFHANLSTSAIHRRCPGNPLGQIAERCQLHPATTSQVRRRDMRTRLNIIIIYKLR